VNDFDLEEEALCYLVAQKVRDFFREAQHRTEFEAWYKSQYGKDFEWRNKH